MESVSRYIQPVTKTKLHHFKPDFYIIDFFIPIVLQKNVPGVISLIPITDEFGESQEEMGDKNQAERWLLHFLVLSTTGGKHTAPV